MNIGLHAAMLERRFFVLEAIRQAAKLGAQLYEIDLGIGKPGESWQTRSAAWREEAPRVRAVADEVGISLSLCLGTLWQCSLASPDAAERQAGVKVVQDCCALAEVLGVPVLLLPIGQPLGEDIERARAQVVESVRHCVQTAEAAGVLLGLENVCQAVLPTAETLVEVVERVDSDACGIYFDLGNPTFLGLDPIAELERAAPHLVRVHLKDTVPEPREHPPLPETPITGDFTVWQRRTTVTLGKGEVDFFAAKRVLTRIGYTGALVIEVPQPAPRAVAGCQENLTAARAFFQSQTAPRG